MSHTPHCTTRKELAGNVWVHYSNPDPDCQDASHHKYDMSSAEGHKAWTP